MGKKNPRFGDTPMEMLYKQAQDRSRWKRAEKKPPKVKFNKGVVNEFVVPITEFKFDAAWKTFRRAQRIYYGEAALLGHEEEPKEEEPESTNESTVDWADKWVKDQGL